MAWEDRTIEPYYMESPFAKLEAENQKLRKALQEIHNFSLGCIGDIPQARDIETILSIAEEALK